jgi:hypothetical protein
MKELDSITAERAPGRTAPSLVIASEAKQSSAAAPFWITSSRSLSSGRPSGESIVYRE